MKLDDSFLSYPNYENIKIIKPCCEERNKHDIYWENCGKYENGVNFKERISLIPLLIFALR